MAKDRIEPFNRVVFDFNMFVDKLIFKPIATMYAGAMPEYGQERVHNVPANMRAPRFHKRRLAGRGRTPRREA